MVLEYLLSQSKHNYDALLMLVRLYMHLGAGSLAMDRYTRLTIKNIQHATVSWILFVRISTIHPWPTEISAGGLATTTFDPLDELKEAIDWHRTADTLTYKALGRMMGNKQWNMIFGLMETQDSLQNGFARTMLIVEQKRIIRFRSILSKEMGNAPLVIPSALRDNRDRAAFPNYQPTDKPSLEQTLPIASPLASAKAPWLARELSLAFLWDQLHEKHWSHQETEQLKMLVDHSAAQRTASLTAPETWVDETLSNFQDLLSLSVALPETPLGDLLAQLERVRNGLKQHIQRYADEAIPLGTLALDHRTFIPLWHIFHSSFKLLELARFAEVFVNRWLTIVVTNAKSSAHERLRTEVIGLGSVARDIRDTVVGRATEVRNTMANGDRGYLKALQNIVKSEDELGMEIDGLGASSVSIEGTCTILQNSWIEAFDGVIRTKGSM